MSRKLLGVCLLTLLLSAFAMSQTQYLILSTSQGAGSTAPIVSAVARSGGTVIHNFEQIGVVTARSSNPKFAASLAGAASVQAVSKDPIVNWLPDDVVAKEAMKTSAPVGAVGSVTEEFGALQWNLTAIHADETAAMNIRGNGARVAVLDSGAVTSFPDLAPNLNLALSTSFVPDEPDLNPTRDGRFNHGTHVAGIIAAAINDWGTQGVAPEAEIVAVKVLSEGGSGAWDWVISGILYASGPDVHADIINMSLGATIDRINQGGGGAGPLISALARAVNYATASGTLVITSAGNEGLNLNSRIWSIPAQSGSGLAIAATAPIGWATGSTNFDIPASYTNYGQSVIAFAAPGGDSAYPGNEDCIVGPFLIPCYLGDLVFSPAGWDNDYYYFYFASGTSMAAPHASGVAALLVGQYGHMSPDKLKSLIQKGAVDILKPGADPYSGRGRVDALGAVQVPF